MAVCSAAMPCPYSRSGSDTVLRPRFSRRYAPAAPIAVRSPPRQPVRTIPRAACRQMRSGFCRCCRPACCCMSTTSSYPEDRTWRGYNEQLPAAGARSSPAATWRRGMRSVSRTPSWPCRPEPATQAHGFVANRHDRPRCSVFSRLTPETDPQVRFARVFERIGSQKHGKIAEPDPFRKRNADRPRPQSG